jgi:hypothetical protein
MDFVIVTTVVAAGTPAFQGQQPYDIVDLTTVKAELNITDTSKDSLLLRWITEASAAAANFCNRVFPVESLKDQIFPPRDYFPASTVIGDRRCHAAAAFPLAGHRLADHHREWCRARRKHGFCRQV